jgi:hypothetical protein
MKTSIPSEARPVSAALVHASVDLNQIIESLPPAVDPQTMARLREWAEHLAELAELLHPQAGR